MKGVLAVYADHIIILCEFRLEISLEIQKLALYRELLKFTRKLITAAEKEIISFYGRPSEGWQRRMRYYSGFVRSKGSRLARIFQDPGCENAVAAINFLRKDP